MDGPRKSTELARQLIAANVASHDVMAGALTLQADRDTFMRSKISDDNPIRNHNLRS